MGSFDEVLLPKLCKKQWPISPIISPVTWLPSAPKKLPMCWHWWARDVTVSYLDSAAQETEGVPLKLSQLPEDEISVSRRRGA